MFDIWFNSLNTNICLPYVGIVMKNPFTKKFSILFYKSINQSTFMIHVWIIMKIFTCLSILVCLITNIWSLKIWECQVGILLNFGFFYLTLSHLMINYYATYYTLRCYFISIVIFSLWVEHNIGLPHAAIINNKP